MNILVIIVTYNAMSWIKKCLDSVIFSNTEADLFVVDNGSSDGTQNYICQHYPSINFFQSDHNLGFGAANNLGFEYAIQHKYDFVYLLNQDAWIFPDTLINLISASKNNPQYGILSPIQLSGDERTIESGFSKCFPNKSFLSETNKDLVVEVKHVMAAHWLIPLNILYKVGGFSPTYLHYGEDWNFIDRVHYFGYKVGVACSAKSVHDRENRPTSLQKRNHLIQCNQLIRLSNINQCFLSCLIMSLVYEFYFFLKYPRIRILFQYFVILTNIKKILRNRDASKKAGAFLSIQ